MNKYKGYDYEWVLKTVGYVLFGLGIASASCCCILGLDPLWSGISIGIGASILGYVQ